MSLLNNRSNMVLFQNEMGHRSQKIRMVPVSYTHLRAHET